MPTRMLRDWTDSDRVNSLTVHAERFFIRLIMKVDDYGCFFADTRLLKSHLFPLLLDGVREADISRWMAECQKAGLIVLYEANSKKYLEVKGFNQRLRAKNRKFPCPTHDSHTPDECPPEVEEKIEVEVEEKKKVFVRPTMDEILAEFTNSNEGEKFFNYYESNGWKVGKNPMKNWKAAARNWLTNSKNFNGTHKQAHTGSIKTAGGQELLDRLKTNAGRETHD